MRGAEPLHDVAQEVNQVGVAPGAMRHPITAGTGDQLPESAA